MHEKRLQWVNSKHREKRGQCGHRQGDTGQSRQSGQLGHSHKHRPSGVHSGTRGLHSAGSRESRESRGFYKREGSYSERSQSDSAYSRSHRHREGTTEEGEEVEGSGFRGQQGRRVYRNVRCYRGRHRMQGQDVYGRSINAEYTHPNQQYGRQTTFHDAKSFINILIESFLSFVKNSNA